jgi:SAM-dependent methyltransferase
LPLPDSVDGLWCGFAAAFFPDLSTTLALWARKLKPGGWAAITEIDDLFGHEPLSVKSKALLTSYADEARSAGRYDFFMGRRLREHLSRAGFHVTREMSLADAELSFKGPASAEVVEAWRARLNRMRLLHDHCGAHFDVLKAEFLDCLHRPDHRCSARVVCCLAVKTNPDAG